MLLLLMLLLLSLQDGSVADEVVSLRCSYKGLLLLMLVLVQDVGGEQSIRMHGLRSLQHGRRRDGRGGRRLGGRRGLGAGGEAAGGSSPSRLRRRGGVLAAVRLRLIRCLVGQLR